MTWLKFLVHVVWKVNSAHISASQIPGSVYLKCRCDKGEWSAPNLSECLSKSIAPLSELVAGEDPLVAMRRFHEEIGKLVENAQITSGDIVAFINSSEILLAKAHRRLLDSRQTPEMPEWRENFIREVSKVSIHL